MNLGNQVAAVVNRAVSDLKKDVKKALKHINTITANITRGNVADVKHATPLLSQARYITGKFIPDYIICDAGYGDYFIHITGHGIGWRYHEFPPLLAPGNETALKEGMVTSVEPGIYMPGFGGMRIEDIVAVNKDGVDILSKFNRKLG